jgi:hypothetical protein
MGVGGREGINPAAAVRNLTFYKIMIADKV